MAQSPEYPDLRWIPPRSYSEGRPNHQCPSTGAAYAGGPRFITVHYTAGSERSTSAEDGAAYDQRRTDGTSSHYYVDADSVVQCVHTQDRSHTALFHGNLWGIHYELCGTRQTREQWLDAASRPTIRNAARQMARDMRKHSIPLIRIPPRGLREPGAKGVTGHVDWTYGWPEDRGTHTDPGSAFPWDVLLADISEAMGDDDVSAKDVWQTDGVVPAPRVDGLGRAVELDADGNPKDNPHWWAGNLVRNHFELTARSRGEQLAQHEALMAALKAHSDMPGGDFEQVKAAAKAGAGEALAAADIAVTWGPRGE